MLIIPIVEGLIFSSSTQFDHAVATIRPPSFPSFLPSSMTTAIQLPPDIQLLFAIRSCPPCHHPAYHPALARHPPPARYPTLARDPTLARHSTRHQIPTRYLSSSYIPSSSRLTSSSCHPHPVYYLAPAGSLLPARHHRAWASPSLPA